MASVISSAEKDLPLGLHLLWHQFMSRPEKEYESTFSSLHRTKEQAAHIKRGSLYCTSVCWKHISIMFQWDWTLLWNAWKKDKSSYFFLLLNLISWNTDESIPFQNVFYNSEQLYVYSSFICPRSTTNTACGWQRMLPFNDLICFSYFSGFCSWLLRKACWGIFLQPKWDLKNLKLQWVNNFRE